MNIYEKISAITSELQTVAKNLTVSTGKSQSYKAVSERDVLDAIKPLEVKYKVCSYPVSREVLESNLLESEGQYGKKTTLMTRIKTVYRFVNIEKPDEYIETITFAEGMDSQDKGSGKAMTYADKYALMKTYKISTGDDPDVESSKEERYSKRTAPPVKQRATEPNKVIKSSVSPREKLLALISAKGLDINVIASEYGLSPKSTDDDYNKVIKALETQHE